MATATKEQAPTHAPKKPVETFRLRGISVSVFENVAKSNGRDVTFFKSSLQRSYRGDDGEWNTTSSFSRDDLPIAVHLLQQAWQYILEAEAKRGKDDADEE